MVKKLNDEERKSDGFEEFKIQIDLPDSYFETDEKMFTKDDVPLKNLKQVL